MRRHVAGYCPACGEKQLAVTGGGTLVCSNLDCDRQTAAAELLGERDIHHVVQLERDDFTVRHPLSERLDDALLECRIHAAIAAEPGPPAPPGRYRVIPTETGDLVYVPVYIPTKQEQ